MMVTDNDIREGLNVRMNSGYEGVISNICLSAAGGTRFTVTQTNMANGYGRIGMKWSACARNVETILTVVTEFDYDLQVWLVDGIYQDCYHPTTMACQCYGRAHAGERKAPFGLCPV